MKHTTVNRIFAALPGPDAEPVPIEDILAEIPGLTRRAAQSALHALKTEGSVERVRHLGEAPTFRRLAEVRGKREYAPRQGVAYSAPEGPRNPVLALALEEAQRKHGALEFQTAVAASGEPVESAAQAVMEFSQASTALEARMHRLIARNQELEAEVARYREAFSELWVHLQPFDRRVGGEEDDNVLAWPRSDGGEQKG